jgi:ABC-type transport system involved in cytochrome c biogenesis permease component
MGLNSRKAQIIWPIIVLGLAGFVLVAPFAWRALKTRRPGDIKAAVVFGVVQLVVYAAYAFDPSKDPQQLSNITGATVWLGAFTAAFFAAYLYRPLTKDEAMDQAARDQRPGSTYL